MIPTPLRGQLSRANRGQVSDEIKTSRSWARSSSPWRGGTSRSTPQRGWARPAAGYGDDPGTARRSAAPGRRRRALGLVRPGLAGRLVPPLLGVPVTLSRTPQIASCVAPPERPRRPQAELRALLLGAHLAKV